MIFLKISCILCVSNYHHIHIKENTLLLHSEIPRDESTIIFKYFH